MQNSGTSNYLHSIYFTNDTTGYIVGDGGIILKTTNGGKSFINEYPLPESSFTLYPNPANNKITIANNINLIYESIIYIYDIRGKLMISNTLNNQNSIEIDISSLSKGIYMIKIRTEKGIAIKKLVIQ